jgi:hypothetical protein
MMMTEGEKSDTIRVQLQCIADEVREMRMRMERTELRLQMLTESFVVAGLWRTSSSLEKWKTSSSCLSKEEDMLQFEMTTDD